MLKPPLGAGADKLTVHVADACDASAVGLQVSPVSEASGGRGGGGTSVSAKFCEVPFRLATSITVVLALTVEAFSVNPALVDPAAIVTDEGTVTLAAPPVPVVTVSPPVGAGADTVTVHAVEPGVVTVAGVQATALTLNGGLMVTCPPVAITLKALLLAVAPLTLRIWIVEDVLTVVGETVNVAVATTPLAMVVALRPNNKQV
jgi:hypothetical protein